MKKFISILLVAVMLLAMVPSLCVSAAPAMPALPEGNRLDVEHVSATQNKCTLNDGLVTDSCDHVSHASTPYATWSKIWDVTNTYRLGYQFSEPIEIVGKFKEPTQVTDVVFCSQYYASRTNGIKVYLSTDNKDWKEVVTVSGQSAAGWYKFIQYEIDAQGAAYSYIKITQTLADGNGKYQFDCPWVAVYDNSAANIIDNLTGKLNVTHQSATTNVFDSATIDWSKVWNDKNTDRLGYEFSNAVEIVGKFDEATRVSDIVFNSVYYHSRMNGVTVSLSVDGNQWTEALTIKGQSGESSYRQIGFSLNSGHVQYNYIKISQNTANDQGKYPLDLTWVSVYNVRAHALQHVTHVSNAGDGDASSVWDFDETTNYANIGNQSVSGTPMVTGKFDVPTVIDRIYLNLHKGYEARNNYTSFEASVDGVEWVSITAQATNMHSNSDTTTGTDFVVFEVADNTAYSYIRLIKNNTYWWTLYSIGVEGTARPDLVERMSMVGFQRSAVVDGKYALRVIALADSADLEGVGMYLSVGAQNGQEWSFKATANKFETITAGSGENAKTITAAQKGGAVFYTAVIEGVPEDVGLFSITATPFFTDGQTERKQGTNTVVVNNTEAAVSELYAFENIKDDLKISGRSLELAKGIACDFTASGIEFNAVLAGDLKLKVDCTGTTYYTLYLNGVRQERLKFNAGTAEYVIAKGLPAKTYNVKLVKQTHIGHTNSTLLEMTMTGNFLEKPKDNDILIEFVGDSITCGYGVVGYPTAGVTYYGTQDYCDSTEAYAYKTAMALGADYSMVSVSGWAMLEGGSCIPDLVYDYTSFKRGNELYKPERTADIVVVNLGTNDYSMATYETEFVKQYEEFVLQIREMNPDAKIILAYGMMHSGDRLANIEAKLNQVVERVGGADSEIWAVKLPTNTAAGNSHPSAAGHTEAAKVLADFIQKNCL